MQSAPLKNAPKLDGHVQMQLGQGLRQMYEALAPKPMPNYLLKVVAKLEEKATPGGPA
jgi:hypothetical protein